MAALGLVPVFLQYAQGRFITEVTGEFHCGRNHDSPKIFEYEVTLHYPADALDAEGFLQDNLTYLETVEHYFNSIHSTELSCEQLSRKAAKDLCEISPETCCGVKCGIWPIENKVKIEYLHPKN
jgi:hypothetical protein